jgi:hypothetical protein
VLLAGMQSKLQATWNMRLLSRGCWTVLRSWSRGAVIKLPPGAGAKITNSGSVSFLFTIDLIEKSHGCWRSFRSRSQKKYFQFRSTGRNRHFLPYHNQNCNKMVLDIVWIPTKWRTDRVITGLLRPWSFLGKLSNKNS